MKTTFTDKYPNETLKALSWKQPFASLMLHGKVETRVWGSKYLGWVLICASKAPYSSKQLREISGDAQFKRIYDTFQGDTSNWSTQPTGVAIAIGKLINSQPMNSNDSENCFVQYVSPWYKEGAKGTTKKQLWCHEYGEVQAIEPFAWHGKLGWSTVPDTLKSKIIIL